MVRANWLLTGILLAGLVPWDEAGAERLDRGRGPSGAPAVRTRAGAATRWRDTAGVSGPLGRGGLLRGAGPIGIVHEAGGTRHVLRPGDARGGGRVVVQIDRTRRMLDLVRARAERCGSAEARDVLQRAIEMQERAESAVRAGRELGALQLTRSAREQGYIALRHCGDTGRSSVGAASAIGRTDELLRLERRNLAERPATPAEGRFAALERAAAAQRRAHADFRDGRFESSLRRTQEARQSLRRETLGDRPARPAPRPRIERPAGERRDVPARRRPGGD